jgi:2-dehydro-3-deoxygalactonokinase
MELPEYMLCGDWGTSNFRLYLVETSGTKILGQLKSNVGVAKLALDFKEQSALKRIYMFRNYLEGQIKELCKGLTRNLDGVPVVLSGMSSSSIGIAEVPYATLPLNLSEPELKYQEIPASAAYPHQIYVFGGLCSSDDVMRGEEAQLIGLKDLLPEADCMVVLPGTHSKHITLCNQRITAFRTYMTGELFHVLKNHSILKNSLAPTENAVQPSIYFEQGVRKALETGLAGSLFQIRANSLLKHVPADSNEDFLSGVLIGAELQSLKGFRGPVALGGSNPLLTLYQSALGTLGIHTGLRTIEPKQLDEAIPRAHIRLMNNLI